MDLSHIRHTAKEIFELNRSAHELSERQQAIENEVREKTLRKLTYALQGREDILVCFAEIARNQTQHRENNKFAASNPIFIGRTQIDNPDSNGEARNLFALVTAYDATVDPRFSVNLRNPAAPDFVTIAIYSKAEDSDEVTGLLRNVHHLGCAVIDGRPTQIRGQLIVEECYSRVLIAKPQELQRYDGDEMLTLGLTNDIGFANIQIAAIQAEFPNMVDTLELLQGTAE